MISEHQGKRMVGGRRVTGKNRPSPPDLPLVSVITVVYNGASHIEQTIKSVLKQNYEKTEYIIIDGGSTDGTLEIIRKFEADIDYWASEKDKGIYDAMNKGIALAQGELIGLLNGDDYYEPGAISLVVERFIKDQMAGIYYGNHYVLREDLNLRYKSYPHMKYWLGMCLCHQTMFVHKDVYREIGFYDTRYRLAADYDFILRSFFRNIPYIHTNSSLVNYRDTGLSSNDYLLSIGEAKDIHKKYYPSFNSARLIYLLRYYKTFFLFYIQKIIRSVFGSGILDRARILYLKLFYAKESEFIQK